MQLSYSNSHLGILLCPCLIRRGGDLGLRRGEAMLGDYPPPPPSSVSLEGRREVGTTRRGGRGLLIVRKTSFLLNPCKARSNIFFQRRLSLMTQFFSFSNFLFPDSFAAWRFSGSSRGGGSRNNFLKRFDSWFRAIGSGGYQCATSPRFPAFRKHCRF